LQHRDLPSPSGRTQPVAPGSGGPGGRGRDDPASQPRLPHCSGAPTPAFQRCCASSNLGRLRPVMQRLALHPAASPASVRFRPSSTDAMTRHRRAWLTFWHARAARRRSPAVRSVLVIARLIAAPQPNTRAPRESNQNRRVTKNESASRALGMTHSR